MTIPATITLIGFGEVGQIFARGFLKAGVTDLRTFDIAFAQPDAHQRRAASELGVRACTSAAEAVRGSRARHQRRDGRSDPGCRGIDRPRPAEAGFRPGSELRGTGDEDCGGRIDRAGGRQVRRGGGDGVGAAEGLAHAHTPGRAARGGIRARRDRARARGHVLLPDGRGGILGEDVPERADQGTRGAEHGKPARGAALRRRARGPGLAQGHVPEPGLDRAGPLHDQPLAAARGTSRRGDAGGGEDGPGRRRRAADEHSDGRAPGLGGAYAGEGRQRGHGGGRAWYPARCDPDGAGARGVPA